MKRYGILLALASTILLAGCGDKGQNMSFQDAYTAFGKQLPHVSLPQIDSQRSSAGSTTVDVSVSAPQGFSASGQIIASGAYDATSGAAIIDITIKGKAFEPSFGSNIIIDGLVRLVNDTKNTYAYIDTFSLVPETGDADGGIITAIIGTIGKKWIQLSENGMGGIPSYQDNGLSLLTHLQEALHQFPLFTGTEKTTIDGEAAYKLAWDAEGVSGFIQYLLQDAKNLGQQVSFSGQTVQDVTKGVLDSPIVGYLIIHDSDDVELRIDSMKMTDLGDLAFSLSREGLTMKLSDLADNTIIMTGDAQGNDDGIAFHINVPSNKLAISGNGTDHMKQWTIALNTPDAQINLRTISDFRAINGFTPVQIGTSTSLTQIIQGFSMLGLGGEMMAQ